MSFRASGILKIYEIDTGLDTALINFKGGRKFGSWEASFVKRKL